MSDRLFAGQVPFSTYQRSTAALIVALLWALTFALAVSLETATRGTMIAAMIPRIVTTANNSISEKPFRLRAVRVILGFLYVRRKLLFVVRQFTRWVTALSVYAV